MNTQILTANDLLSGGVVFLTDQRKWSSYISQARISHDADTAQKLELIGQDAVGEQIVVEPFLFDVRRAADAPLPHCSTLYRCAVGLAYRY